jgi:hypothetical protein
MVLAPEIGKPAQRGRPKMLVLENAMHDISAVGQPRKGFGRRLKGLERAMTALTQKKTAQRIVLRHAVPALAAVSAVLIACGCDNAAGAWASDPGGSRGASPSAAQGATAVAPRDDGTQVAMAAPAVTDRDAALDQKPGVSGSVERLAQGGNQHPAARQPGHRPAATANQRRPLVVIRFDRQDVPYEPALYTAISRALEWRPTAVFDLVAVSPSAGSDAETAKSADEAQRDAERVMRTLSQMGLPADRVTLSAMFSTGVRDNEVQIFVR